MLCAYGVRCDASVMSVRGVKGEGVRSEDVRSETCESVSRSESVYVFGNGNWTEGGNGNWTEGGNGNETDAWILSMDGTALLLTLDVRRKKTKMMKKTNSTMQ